MQNLDRYFREDTPDAVLEMHVWTFQISFYSAVCHFRWTLRKRKANGKRRSFRVRGCNVEAEVAEVVFRN